MTITIPATVRLDTTSTAKKLQFAYSAHFQKILWLSIQDSSLVVYPYADPVTNVTRYLELKP